MTFREILRHDSKFLKVAISVLWGMILLFCQPAFAMQSIEDWTDEDDLGADMRANIILCRGFESDLVSLARNNRFPQFYAQLSPVAETLNSGREGKIISLYRDLIEASKDEEALTDLQHFYLRFEKLAAHQQTLADEQIWAIARSHYYLTYFQSKLPGDAKSYYRFSQKLLSRLLDLTKSDIRDRAILYVVSNVAALDVKGRHVSIFQGELIGFLTDMRAYYPRVAGRLNRKIASHAKPGPSSIGAIVESAEKNIGFYKTEVENDLILLFHLQTSFRYVFNGELSSKNAGLSSVLTWIPHGVVQLSAICSPGLLSANVKLLHHRFPAFRGDENATSITEKFVFNFFDLGEGFAPKFWFNRR